MYYGSSYYGEPILSSSSILLMVILYFVITVISAFCFREVSRMKGHGDLDSTVLILCIIGGIVGWIYVAALPDRAGFAAPRGSGTTPNTSRVEFRGNDLPDL